MIWDSSEIHARGWSRREAAERQLLRGWVRAERRMGCLGSTAQALWGTHTALTLGPVPWLEQAGSGEEGDMSPALVDRPNIANGDIFQQNFP